MINTVLGPIAPDNMGVTLSHEHIACYSQSMRQSFGNRWFDPDELIAASVKLLTNAREKFGIQTIVDGTPNDLGRDIHILREISRQSQVNIIASSGMYYSEEPFLINKSPEFFADFFIEECQNGIIGTKVFPGALKCATGIMGFTPVNVSLLKTMSIVQKATGLPLYAHSTHSIKTAARQLDIFEENGVDLKRVIIGHCSDTNDTEYLEALLRRGCYLSFDRIGPSPDSNLLQAETMKTLLLHGYEDKLLLSHDFCVFIDFRDNSWEKTKAGNFENLSMDFTYIHRSFIKTLKSVGVTDAQLEKMLVMNPCKIYDAQKVS